MARHPIEYAKMVVQKSIFRKIEPNTAMNDILAILFHRTAATMYAIYTLWAIVATIDGVPSIIRAEGSLLQVIFSAMVFFLAAPAALGATFWPMMARLELFAGSAFIGAMLFYLYVLLRNLFETTEGSWAGWIVIWSIVVLPAARTVVVTILLLRQARERREALAQAKAEAAGA